MNNEIRLQAKKRFEQDDDEASRVRPAYINNIDIARIGPELFLDMCIMPMDDLAKAKELEATGGDLPVEVIVLDRDVFGVETFFRLHHAVNSIYSDLEKAGAVPQNATIQFHPK